MDDPLLWAAAVIVIGVVALAAWVSTPIRSASVSRSVPDDETEGVFPVNAEGLKGLREGKVDTANTRRFPNTMVEDPQVDLTLVVPAYKEAARLPAMMKETMPALLQLQREDGVTWEIVIVDDGSSDDTSGVAVKYVEEHAGPDGSYPVRLCRLKTNRGKGGAVRMGMLRTRGRFLLMIDADGATAASEILTIYRRGKALLNADGHALVVGSRAAAEDGESKASRDGLRAFTQWGMRMAVRFIGGVSGIRDTQCGFKLFSRNTARLVFPPLHIERWAFDVEVLYLAKSSREAVPVFELPVEWHEIEGSHLEVVSASLQIIRDMLATRFCYTTGLWSSSDAVAAAKARAGSVSV